MAIKLHTRRPCWRTLTIIGCANVIAVLASVCPAAVVNGPLRAPTHLPLLTTTRQIHTLTYRQAALGYPVRVRGVVTIYDPNQEGIGVLFLSDRTGGIFVDVGLDRALPVHSGSLIEVSGVTDPGGFAPILSRPKIRLLASISPLPRPKLVSLPHLLEGTEDGEWVALSGVVHSVNSDGAHVRISLATDDGPIMAIATKEDGADYASLVDSTVQIRGVSVPQMDGHRGMIGVSLLFPGIRSITVKERAPGDPFALPVRPINSLLQFSPHGISQHRIHVQGQVVLSWPGRLVCIVDAQNGICVHTADGTLLKTGQFVELAGFTGLDHYEPTLLDASLRPGLTGSTGLPNRILAESSLEGKFQGQVVQIDGTLLGQSSTVGERTLLLLSDKTSFTAVLPPTPIESGGPVNSAWILGSKVSLTGVFDGSVDTQHSLHVWGFPHLKTFQILLRSPDDIMVVQAPSWWNGRNTLSVLGVVGVVTLLILCWVAVLRHQVEQQTEVIRDSEEKYRHMARHDALTGLPTRTVLFERLEVALKADSQKPGTVALMMIDVDDFKRVNDTLGHAAGDEVLCAVAERILSSVRETDTVARMGGDEFTVLLQGIHGMEDARRIAAHVVENASLPLEIEGHRMQVSISAGLAVHPDGGEGPHALLRSADVALYQAKSLGRNCYQAFSQEIAASNSNQRELNIA